jgi:hypothetical protein
MCGIYEITSGGVILNSYIKRVLEIGVEIMIVVST